VGAVGVTAMDFSVGAVTVKVVVPETPAEVAVMVVEPAAAPVARPAALIAAVAGVDDVHVTEEEISLLEPSEYIPAAENWVVSPATTLGSDGVMEIDWSTLGGGASSPPPQPAITRISPTVISVANDLIRRTQLSRQLAFKKIIQYIIPRR
jgi:hypothetical protein